MANMLEQHDEMTHVTASLEGIGTLSATIGQNKISLKVTGPSRNDAEYFVTFSSGTLQFLVGPHKSVTIVSLPGGGLPNTLSMADRLILHKGPDRCA